ncbi:hypothetical protein TWF718_010023 [Orbilia javanica]|uniref:Uncharacterized protein n=1 Tax=Orbilia javanica TaxID=47235 RepID=A0AAN8RBV6_9PEZI
MSTEAPTTTTSNTQISNPNNHRLPSPSGILGVEGATTRDLNAQEWSQAVIDELRHIQVATPPMRYIARTQLPGNVGDQVYMHSSYAGRLAVDSSELAERSSGKSQRSGYRPELPERPQVKAMDSTATVDVVKKIPGSW